MAHEGPGGLRKEEGQEQVTTLQTCTVKLQWKCNETTVK